MHWVLCGAFCVGSITQCSQKCPTRSPLPDETSDAPLEEENPHQGCRFKNAGTQMSALLLPHTGGGDGHGEAGHRVSRGETKSRETGVTLRHTRATCTHCPPLLPDFRNSIVSKTGMEPRRWEDREQSGPHPAPSHSNSQHGKENKVNIQVQVKAETLLQLVQSPTHYTPFRHSTWGSSCKEKYTGHKTY